MRNRVAARRGRILAQASTVAVLAALAAACSADATRVREPFFTGSTPNQQAIISGAQPGDQVVAGAPLPPPGAPGAIDLAGGTGGWSAVGGNVVTVGPGESLETLAIKYGVPIQELAKANGISSPSQVTPGRAIVIPRQQPAAYAAAEPVAATAPADPAAVVKGGEVIHVVEPGQTLYGIARAQGVNPGDIMALNGMSSEMVRVGQRLKIPGGGTAPAPQTAALSTGDPGSQVRGEPPKTLGTLPAPSPESMPVTAPAPVAGSPQAPEVPTLPAAAPATEPTKVAAVDTSADPPSANGTSFRWPVRGRIISDFGTKPSGEKNDGINLAVPEGTSVKAAEAGTVIYAGNELAGYGNLVLIRHADGWVSAYAHNSKITVNRGDTVQRGQTIALAGMTGSVTSPQVHFELRKGAKPVNPMDHLSGT
ncbi:MAG TPA: peptidoglycan DD-metalloendopeptidase family protein [Bauldia sp.]|nr:peptidoglycan DD-metalloendopeptidase family protein [Bauldia sp.]